MKEITKRKKSVYMKVTEQLLESVDWKFGQEPDDFSRGLITILSQLEMKLRETNETLDLTFSHELPLTWADYMRKAKGLPYKSETIQFNKMFEVQYRSIFPDAPEGSCFEAGESHLED